VIVPSLPVTPGPAVTAPVTGGQIWAQAPLQFDLVAVSGANEYTVKPLALVTTVTPLICAVFSAPPAAAALEAGALDAEAGAALDAEAGTLEGVAPALPLDDELEHAAALIAAAAVPAAASIVIRILMDISLTGDCPFRHEPPEAC
jgi:hypothetical protein